MLGVASLRRTSTIAMVAVAALVIAASVTLAVITALVNRSSRQLAASVERIHTIEDARNALLRRRQDDLPAADAAVATSDAALAALAAAELAEARQVQRRVERWESEIDAICIALATVIAVALGLLIWWIQRALRPVEALAGAMDRFGRGETAARATPSGAAELHKMALHFNDMAATLARQREAQMTFLAGVAHDLRNPLQALQMSIELVCDPHGPVNPRLQPTLDRLGRQVARLDRMVTDLLDVARIEAGQLELQLELQDARVIVSDVAELLRVVSPRHQIEVEVPAAPVWLRCDPLRIDQVMTNLLSNAIKYSPRGGRIDVAVTTRGDEVVLAVSDQGIGMNDADVAALFEPFRRGGAVHVDIRGAGLGMSVVRRIVDAHAGRIDVHSALGHGSTFEVHLPAAAPVVPAEGSQVLQDRVSPDV